MFLERVRLFLPYTRYITFSTYHSPVSGIACVCTSIYIGLQIFSVILRGVKMKLLNWQTYFNIITPLKIKHSCYGSCDCSYFTFMKAKSMSRSKNTGNISLLLQYNLQKYIFAKYGDKVPINSWTFYNKTKLLLGRLLIVVSNE